MEIVRDNSEDRPSLGEIYWTFYYDLTREYVQVIEVMWKNDLIDNKRYREGRIFKNRRQAEDGLKKRMSRLATAREILDS